MKQATVSNAVEEMRMDTKGDARTGRGRAEACCSTGNDWVVRRRPDGSRYIARRRPHVAAAAVVVDDSQLQKQRLAQHDSVMPAYDAAAAADGPASKCRETVQLGIGVPVVVRHHQDVDHDGATLNRDLMKASEAGERSASSRQRRHKSSGRRTAAEERRMRRITIAVDGDGMAAVTGSTTTDDDAAAAAAAAGASADAAAREKRTGRQRKRVGVRGQMKEDRVHDQPRHQTQDAMNNKVPVKDVAMTSTGLATVNNRMGTVQASGDCRNLVKAVSQRNGGLPVTAVYDNVTHMAFPLAFPYGLQKRSTSSASNPILTVVTV